MDIPKITPESLDERLCVLFDSERDLSVPGSLRKPIDAFIDLVGIYLTQTHPEVLNEVGIDYGKIACVLKRFHRDAFGVQGFVRFLDNLVAAEKCSMPTRIEIVSKLKDMGIRVNSQFPRKTRIAAVMTLWLSALQPVYLKRVAFEGVPSEDLECLNGSLTFWISTAYLSKFGTILIENNTDWRIRLARIKYDLTFRALGLSSLEVLYSGLFRSSQPAQ